MRHVLVISRFFPPEAGAAQERIRSFACGLAKKGHQVTVLTTYPSYPEYRARAFKKSEETVYENVRVRRIWSPLFGRRFRLITDLYFSFAAAVVGLSQRKVDVVLVSSPPFFLGFTAVILRKLRNIPYIFDVRDLYPDSLIDTGFIQRPMLQKLLFFLERKFYLYADAITVVSDWMKSHIEKKQIPVPIHTLYNGVDKGAFDAHQSAHQETIFPYIDPKKKHVIYIGNFGRVYDFDVLLQSAKKLEELGMNILLVGGGHQKQYMADYITDNALGNVQIIDALPPAQIPALLSQVDVGYVALQDIPLAAGSIPTKMFEYIAAGLPIVAQLHGEARHMFDGYYISIQTPQDIEHAVSRQSFPVQQSIPDLFLRDNASNQLEQIIQMICKKK